MLEREIGVINEALAAEQLQCWRAENRVVAAIHAIDVGSAHAAWLACERSREVIELHKADSVVLGELVAGCRYVLEDAAR